VPTPTANTEEFPTPEILRGSWSWVMVPKSERRQLMWLDAPEPRKNGMAEG
jgi:hypothetical protein